MKKQNRVEGRMATAVLDGEELFSALIAGPAASAAPDRISGVIVGELVGMADGGRTPLVVYPGQPGSAAIAARSVVDLRGAHIGKPVVLVFQGGDPEVPIVLGVVRAAEAWPLDQKPGQVEVEADGERLTVTAKEELVLRCGEASITLTKAGKVLIHGRYVSSRSSGVNRIKGGSVHIN
jgi:uncharacterized protein DUF6484